MYIEAEFSDLHKDAMGSRPDRETWYKWLHSTPSEKQHIWDLLIDQLRYQNEHTIPGL